MNVTLYGFTCDHAKGASSRLTSQMDGLTIIEVHTHGSSKLKLRKGASYVITIREALNPQRERA